jgi:hypothetical protein
MVFNQDMDIFLRGQDCRTKEGGVSFTLTVQDLVRQLEAEEIAQIVRAAMEDGKA